MGRATERRKRASRGDVPWVRCCSHNSLSQLRAPFILGKPSGLLTLRWPVGHSVVVKRRDRGAPGDHHGVLGHIADCDVFGGIDSYKGPGGCGKRQKAGVRKESLPLVSHGARAGGVPGTDKTLLCAGAPDPMVRLKSHPQPCREGPSHSHGGQFNDMKSRWQALCLCSNCHLPTASWQLPLSLLCALF